MALLQVNKGKGDQYKLVRDHLVEAHIPSSLMLH